MLTTQQAAEYLGITTGRVRQLIGAGLLEAEKTSHGWLVSEGSVGLRAGEAKSGRPSRRESRQLNSKKLENYILRSRNHDVALCTYDPNQTRFIKLEILDPLRVPFALLGYQAKNNQLNTFNEWWGERAIPRERKDLRFRLDELDLLSPFELPFKSLGLSLSDQFWLCPIQENLCWSDVNFFDNSFELGSLEANDSMCEWMNAVGLQSPDNTSEGMLSKRWICDESGHRLLLKGSGASGREAVNEVIATRLYRRLLQASEYTEYKLATWNGKAVSTCETFIHPDEEFIPAWYIKRLHKKPNNWNEYRQYYETCADLGVVEAIAYVDRMLVCDSILANTDRHWFNFGILRNVETLECRPAPIYDTGNCLWADTDLENLLRGDYRFTAKPFYPDPQRQLDLVFDGRWFRPDALEGFTDEVHDILASRLYDNRLISAICRGLEGRLDTVARWWKHTPTRNLPSNLAEQTEMVDWVFI